MLIVDAVLSMTCVVAPVPCLVDSSKQCSRLVRKHAGIRLSENTSPKRPSRFQCGASGQECLLAAIASSITVGTADDVYRYSLFSSEDFAGKSGGQLSINLKPADGALRNPH